MHVCLSVIGQQLEGNGQTRKEFNTKEKKIHIMIQTFSFFEIILIIVKVTSETKCKAAK